MTAVRRQESQHRRLGGARPPCGSALLVVSGQMSAILQMARDRFALRKRDDEGQGEARHERGIEDRSSEFRRHDLVDVLRRTHDCQRSGSVS